MATIEYNTEDEVLAIHDVGQAVRHPLLAAFTRQANGFVDEAGVIHVPTSSTELTTLYRTIARLFDKLKINIETGEHVSDAVRSVESEEALFDEFSRKAKEIWEAQIDTSDFRRFVEIVEEKCPGRVFYRKQLLSAFHLAFSQNACNFSVPGAGKTSVVYAAYAYLSSLGLDDAKSVDRLLIVGPLSSFKAWEDEFAAIFQRSALAKRISGQISMDARIEHLRGISVASRTTELTLTTYQTLANMEEEITTFLQHVGTRAMVVLDEAHYIKSSDGQQAAAALRLAPLARSRVVLTGTPAPNGYEDLSNLFRFIYPNRNVAGFPPATLKAMTDGSMPGAVTELKKRIQPYYTRIRKTDLSLPKVEEKRVEVPMIGDHEKIYRTLEKRIVPHLGQHFEDSSAGIRLRARLIRLRQAVVNPELLLRPLEQEEGIFDTGGTGDLNVAELEVADLVNRFVADTNLARLDVCRSLVKSVLNEQGKVLIWSYFLGNLELLKQGLSSYAPFVEVLTGATPVADREGDAPPEIGTREEIIDRFHSTSGKAVLIANPQAVGESISLHKACRTAIYFDRDFNAGRFIQSKDRIHRYNPLGGRTVTYHHLVTPASVDKDIDARLTIKEQRLAELVDADDIPLLTAAEDNDQADLRMIFESYEHRKTK
ncbi:DEAD/DEAH box helicase [Rhodophyticola sp. CCM32]|uniref:SNF2-related protein n=1 Tax=Rhodophyticola sp. CCM32 TaxID=2916397 RepID=UPI00107F2A04|nr:DEAD/DEAH box helicase [Rhodophyticola sp. CCM32]QBX99472.1 DEAD/DEAH box helicase [Rhodophyticola sp. CCM32]